MEFNTTTGIWPKIKEYIDSKLSSTGGGVVRIFDKSLSFNTTYNYGKAKVMTSGTFGNIGVFNKFTAKEVTNLTPSTIWGDVDIDIDFNYIYCYGGTGSDDDINNGSYPKGTIVKKLLLRNTNTGVTVAGIWNYILLIKIDNLSESLLYRDSYGYFYKITDSGIKLVDSLGNLIS